MRAGLRPWPAIFLWAAMALPWLALAGAAVEAPAPSPPAASLVILRPWVRATMGGVTVSAAYLDIKNTGTEEDRLLGVRTSAAARVEIHTHSMEGGVMKMREAPALAIPPQSTIVLAPSDTHLMLTGLVRPLRAGEYIKLTLIFERAGEVDVEAPVVPVGSSAPP